MKVQQWGPLFFVGILLGYYFVFRMKEIGLVDLTYIVTETKGPDSFDPIDADKTQNLSIMRMLFATPLEVDRNNTLQSKILSSFDYYRDQDQILFEVREDQKYSDGTVLTADDVALSIARIAYFRPQFPVIKDILGIQEWSAEKKGLSTFPKGIRVVGNKIILQLFKKSANPLFRFCLELFSVIPSKCIDLKTGAMNCKLPPSSGYFVLKRRNSEEILFEKREFQNSVDSIEFETIKFKFDTLSGACKKDLAVNEIISGVEIDYLGSNCGSKLLASQIHWMPSARFGVLRFNPSVFPFNSRSHRQYFAETVRKILIESNQDLLVERGLFSKLLPGYVPNNELEKDYSDEIKESFTGVQITLPKMPQAGLSLVFDVIIEAASRLKMNISLLQDPSNEDLIGYFLAGDVPVVAGASGFWAQDPVGDISMWFTPNLHKTMSFVWTDKNIYEQIRSLEVEPDPVSLKKKMTQLNRYVSEQALIAPIVHFRRMFVSSKKLTRLNLPQAVTSPAPWQLIPVE